MSKAFHIAGTKAMKRKLERITREFPNAVKRALKIEAELVMASSKRHYVPVDLGTLRASGFVNEPVRTGKDVSVTMGYGGAAKAYALTVHETPSEHDPRTWKGKEIQFGPGDRGPKYLERPLMAAVNGTPDLSTGGLEARTMAERVADRVAESVEKAAGS